MNEEWKEKKRQKDKKDTEWIDNENKKKEDKYMRIETWKKDKENT